MISLKNYLRREEAGEADRAYRRVIDLFLEGIALHAVEGDGADFQRFRTDLDACAASLTPQTPPPELSEIAARAVHAMEEYNLRTSKFVRQQRTELQNMVSMLTETVITIGASSEASTGKLQEIEKSLNGARLAQDIQVLKLKLGECLRTVRHETQRQKAEGERSLAVLQAKLQHARERVGCMKFQAALDPATQLPSRKEAEKAIQAAAASPDGKFLLIAVVGRLQTINARFGYSIGDRILGACAEHFRSSLSEGDQLFRWQGPAMLAILSREERIDLVRAKIRRFADVKLENAIDVGNRSIVIPVSTNWSLMPVTSPFEALLKKVDAFTAAQIPYDYA
jgi:GGDEF domain-containing protein